MSRSGAQVQAEPSRVPPASGVIGGRLWPGLSVPVTPCCSSNTYQFVPSRCFLSMNIIPLSEKQIFLFSLYIKGDKGETGADGNDGVDEKDGISLVWLGSFDSADEIENPKYLNAYFNTTV